MIFNAAWFPTTLTLWHHRKSRRSCWQKLGWMGNCVSMKVDRSFQLFLCWSVLMNLHWFYFWLMKQEATQQRMKRLFNKHIHRLRLTERLSMFIPWKDKIFQASIARVKSHIDLRVQRLEGAGGNSFFVNFYVYFRASGVTLLMYILLISFRGSIFYVRLSISIACVCLCTWWVSSDVHVYVSTANTYKWALSTNI